MVRWTQTDPESCGAAALMVALSEAGIANVSPELEMDLWKRIRASGQYPGSIPGRIALEAKRQGMVPRVWVDPDRIAVTRIRLGDRAAFDVPTLLREHTRALTEAQKAGISVDEEPTDPGAMLQAMQGGAALLAGFVVLLPDQRISLHWRLYRVVGDAIWEMDPAGGNEAPKSENQLVELLTEETYIGVAVSLRRA